MNDKVDSAKPAAKPAAAKKPAGVKPLYALNKIVYGKAQTAPGKSIFLPTSEKEREDILKLGAGRELTDVEVAVAAQMKLGAAAAADAGEDFE